MKRLLALLVIIASLTALPARADVRRESYVAGPLGDADGVCRHDTPAPAAAPNVGAVCFTSLSSFSSVRVAVDDLAPYVVGFWAGFARSGGTSMGGRWYCANSANIAIPSGAARLYVYIGGARAPLEACIEELGVGTNGTVTATLT